MDDRYDPKGLISKKVEYPKIPGEFYTEETDPLERKETTVFTLKQSYDVDPCATIYCKICGSDKFIIGEGSYLTAIKCPNCDYELVIHDG